MPDRRELDACERRAWEALAVGTFSVFGYYADRWTKLNWRGGFKRPNPFKPLTKIAEARQEARARNLARIGLKAEGKVQ